MLCSFFFSFVKVTDPARVCISVCVCVCPCAIKMFQNSSMLLKWLLDNRFSNIKCPNVCSLHILLVVKLFGFRMDIYHQHHHHHVIFFSHVPGISRYICCTIHLSSHQKCCMKMYKQFFLSRCCCFSCYPLCCRISSRYSICFLKCEPGRIRTNEIRFPCKTCVSNSSCKWKTRLKSVFGVEKMKCVFHIWGVRFFALTFAKWETKAKLWWL